MGATYGGVLFTVIVVVWQGVKLTDEKLNQNVWFWAHLPVVPDGPTVVGSPVPRREVRSTQIQRILDIELYLQCLRPLRRSSSE